MIEKNVSYVKLDYEGYTEFHFLDGMLKAGAKGIGVNFKDKTVAWTSEPSKYYNYFIKVEK